MSRLDSLIASGSAIAVVGMAGRFPGARNVRAYWKNIREGIESIRTLDDKALVARGVPRELLDDPAYVKVAADLPGMDHFDAGFFGFSPRDAAILDPQHRHFLEVSWEALEDAGHAPGWFEGPVGVFAGSGANSYFWANIMTNPALVRDVGFFLLRHTGNDKDFLSTRVSYELDLTGPSVNVQTACSTSLTAVHLAVQSLLLNECDMALAGGVAIEQPHGLGYLHKEGEILSPDGHCRPFDAQADGTVFGSGVGVVVLRRLEDAVADGDHIDAVILGSAVNNDGAMKVGYLAPSVDGQARAIAEALGASGVDPNTLGYVEAHGTGTKVGDPIEVAALTQAFRTGTDRCAYCALGSVKANIGHADTAAGVAGLIKVICALRARELPPTVHFDKPNEAIDFAASPFFVPTEPLPWTADGPRRAAVSSLGVGGTNAFVVLEEAPPLPARRPNSRPLHLLPFSGRSERVREAAGADLAAFLECVDPPPLDDIAWTLAMGRRPFAHRRVVLAATSEEAIEALVRGDPARVLSGEAGETAPGVSFLFAGGGAQHAGMGAGLYRDEPVYRTVVDECLDLLDPTIAGHVRRFLLDGVDGTRAASAGASNPTAGPPPSSESPSLALPALFITQLAQARLWISWGIRPASMLGHSMGEYTAACLAGVLQTSDALRLVVARGRLFEELPEGGMLGVHLSEHDLREILPKGVSIAAVNGPDLTVASGPVGRLAELQEVLAVRGVESRRIRISVAAHSAMLDPILERFRGEVSRIPLRAPEIPFASNLTGEWITADEARDPDYWVRQLRGTVRFADGVSRLVRMEPHVLLEVGPGRTLATLARMCVSRDEAPDILTSMRHPGEDHDELHVQLTTLARLWTLGIEVDWRAFHTGGERRRVSLPTYPFERDRYFIEPGQGVPLQIAPAPAAPRPPDSESASDPLAGWFWKHVWKPVPLDANRLVPAPETVGPLLLLGEGTHLDEAVARALAALGVDALPVTDLPHALARLREEGRSPAGVVYLALLGLPDASPVDQGERERLAFYRPLELLQALGEHDPEGELPFLFLSTAMHQARERDTVEPWKALALGPIRTAPRELPGILTRSIDLGPDLTADPDAIAALLLTELEQSGPRATAYRAGDRLGQNFVPLVLGAPTEHPVSSEGTYLVTGGLGGLGRTFALYLAERGARHILLLSRSGLPPRGGWDAWLLERPDSNRVSAAIRTVRELEARGCRVEIAPVDVTNAAAVRAIVDREVERTGAIRGVIHAAGTLDDEPLLVRDPVRSARVLAPKVRGVVALAEALGDRAPDFEILCSSRSAISGVPGQIDYTAANAFLDAWATHARASGRNVVSVEWDAWREVGMAHELATGVRSIGPPDHPLEYLDHPIFRERRRRDNGEEFVFARLSAGTHWMLDEHRIRAGPPLIPGAGFLELIRSAFALREGASPILMRDVLFLEPFLVPEGSVREMAIRFRPEGHGYGVAVLGREADGAENAPWTTHVTGHIQAEEAAAPARSAPALPFLPPIGKGNGLHRPVGSGLELGPRWANLRGTRGSSAESVLHLELAEAFRGDLADHPLHPALVDVATAGAQELIAGHDPATEFYIPASYGSFRMLRPLPATFFSHVRYRDPGIEGMATFDVRLVDEEGMELVVVEEFVMLRVDDREAISTDDGARRSTPGNGETKGPTTPKDDRCGIAPSDGVRALDLILGRRDVPPVVAVVPGDLPALLAALDDAGPRESAASHDHGTENVSEVVEALLAHPSVADAAAVSHRYGPDDVRVVAFVVHDHARTGTVSELRSFVRERISPTLVPQSFVEMAEIPRDRRGRLDRSRVNDPFATRDDHVPPSTPTERTIAGIWTRLLGVDRVGAHDNFLDIGGHSLVGIRALLQIERETGVRLHPNVLTLQTLGQIAAECDRLRETLAEESGKVQGGLAGRILDAVRQSVSRIER